MSMSPLPVAVGTPRSLRSRTSDRSDWPVTTASLTLTISAASSGLTVTPSASNPYGRAPPPCQRPACARC